MKGIIGCNAGVTVVTEFWLTNGSEQARAAEEAPEVARQLRDNHEVGPKLRANTGAGGDGVRNADDPPACPVIPFPVKVKLTHYPIP